MTQLTNDDLRQLIDWHISILPDERTSEEAAKRLNPLYRAAVRSAVSENLGPLDYWDRPAMTLVERVDEVMDRQGLRITEAEVRDDGNNLGWWLVLALLVVGMILGVAR